MSSKLQNLNWSLSHYFLEFNERYKSVITKIMKEINETIFPDNTVGPRSVSKSETNKVINKILKNIERSGPVQHQEDTNYSPQNTFIRNALISIIPDIQDDKHPVITISPEDSNI